MGREIRQFDPLLRQCEAAKLMKRSRAWLSEAHKLGLIPPECYIEMPNIMGKGIRKHYLYKRDKLIELGLITVERSENVV